MYNEMKLTHITVGQQSRTLRGFKQKYKLKARTYRGNYPIWPERMREADDMRMMLRVRSRYLGLARAFVKDRDYRSVENQTREDNTVDVDILLDELNYWGYDPDREYLERWVSS